MAIWNTVLSDVSLAELNSGTYNFGSSADLMGHWDFSQGSGSTVYDQSGSGNHGTIFGDAQWSNSSTSGDYTVHIEAGQNYNVSMDGSSIIPDEDYNGLLNIAASVSDLDGGVSNSLSFDLNVSPVNDICLLYTSPSPRDQRGSRMPSSA